MQLCEVKISAVVVVVEVVVVVVAAIVVVVAAIVVAAIVVAAAVVVIVVSAAAAVVVAALVVTSTMVRPSPVRDIVTCQVKISAGRDLALKEQTSQSSTFETWYSRHAVDGTVDLGDNLSGKTCSRTQNDSLSWWRLTFHKGVKINYFILFNRRKYAGPHRLEEFKLEAFGNNPTNSLFTYESPTVSRTEYHIIPDSDVDLPVHEVKITATNGSLVICDLWARGESSCPKGVFGRDCEWTCNCAYETDCFVHSGGCPAGCKLGYNGENCYKPVERLAVFHRRQLTTTETRMKEMPSALASPLVIKCNAEVLGLPNSTEVLRLQIARMLDHKKTTEIIADFDFKAGTRKTGERSGRAWTFNSDGYVEPKVITGRNATKGLEIVWTMLDPQCDDAGIYQCTVIASVHK
ncbi:receptor-type tyrosine-protein phosphatase kappa-like [Elysia marginata]|uniref:Receptor-type tyrosine-protein phosphatase kappa-like n=1 Tax=Elysia marginata TaxID=1093978 RepID=A0AAV4JKR8_9GAST|nr:receptor-type tyrosine-protein phosphatase kappa-like [Elysia marginata]